MPDDSAATATSVRPHPTLLRRGVLLCQESTSEHVVSVNPSTGICPKHKNGACALWYVPWPVARGQDRPSANDIR